MILEGKTAIVTGANRGIGLEIVKGFAKEGASTIFACMRNESRGFGEIAKELSNSYGTRIISVYFDLGSDDEIKKGIKEVLSYKIPIDILVNNAGVSYSGLLQMTSMDKMKELFQINYFAPVLIMQLVSRYMMRFKTGVIINMASVGGIETNPGYLAYGSSKASLIWATKTISKELGQYNIRVNAVAPGLTDTEMGHTKNDEELAKTIARSSLKRMAEPREITDAVIYLASDKSSFMTGHVLVCDGGRI